jgi:hypothetical protein
VASGVLTTLGTLVPEDATDHTKGAYAQLFASTDFDVWGISFMVGATSSAGAIVNYLLDIAIGGAGSEQVIASNILIGNSRGIAPGSPFTFWFLPIFIPKGTRISARTQGSGGTGVPYLMMTLTGGPSNPLWPVFQGCMTIGINTAASGGTSLTPGATGTYSAWTSIGSALSREIKAFQPIFQAGSDSNIGTLYYHLETGYSSTALSRHLFACDSSENVIGIYPAMPIYSRIPSGTQMQMRATCNTASPDPFEFGILGYY